MDCLKACENFEIKQQERYWLTIKLIETFQSIYLMSYLKKLLLGQMIKGYKVDE